MAAFDLTRSRRGRVVEFAALFILLPLLAGALSDLLRRWVLPQVWLLALLGTWLLWRDSAFDRSRLRAWPEYLVPCLRRMLVLFLPGALLLLALAWMIPDLTPFGLPRERPRLWLAVLVLYPLLSALPQELFFRTLFFHRYAPLFGTPARLIAASALCFGLAHLVLGNVVAPLLATLGGALFAYTYWKTRSLILVALEHGLWGDWLFTLGYGRYFYGGHV